MWLGRAGGPYWLISVPLISVPIGVLPPAA
jgi:hypothetical protein